MNYREAKDIAVCGLIYIKFAKHLEYISSLLLVLYYLNHQIFPTILQKYNLNILHQNKGYTLLQYLHYRSLFLK